MEVLIVVYAILTLLKGMCGQSLNLGESYYKGREIADGEWGFCFSFPKWSVGWERPSYVPGKHEPYCRCLSLSQRGNDFFYT